jgi:hypothetical protein
MSGFEERTLDALDDLNLDPLNPRLRQEEEGVDQPELIRIMLARFKIEEIAESILAAGWLEQDPLIAVEEAGRIRVIEGNRRLTAVKLLLDPRQAPKARQARWNSLSSELDDQVRQSITALRVRVYQSRDDPEVSSYIGFRHVTGVLPWPALEKASYIARLAGKGASYRELAEKLGSYPSHVARHHVAHQLVEQAKLWEIDGSSEMGNAFGVLLRALQTQGVRTFIGLRQSEEPIENLRPIADRNKEDLQDFVKWTFGTGSSTRVLPEPRELTRWSKILLSPAAVRYLRNADEPRFDRAWARSGGESEAIADALWKAAYLLADVLPLINEHKDEQSIQEAAREFNRYMKQINALVTPQSGIEGA